MKTTEEIISQKRAIRAIDVGLGISRPGYNIYISGYQGSGRSGVIRTLLEKFGKNLPPPSDWVYVYDFQKKDTPKAIRLIAGEGCKFEKLMSGFVEDLKRDIPAALQSEDYEKTVNAIVSQFNDLQAKKYAELEKIAKRINFQIKSTSIGIETIPLKDNRPVTEKEYSKLSAKEKERVEEKRSHLEPIVLRYARKIRSIETKMKETLHELEKNVGKKVVDAALDPLLRFYRKEQNVMAYLGQVREYLIENLADFNPQEESTNEGETPHVFPHERDPFLKYKINVFVDNQKLKNAPVVTESNPTYYNLFGKVERTVEHGMYVTDFTKIKAGSLHKANGGFLLLDINDVLKTPYVWDALKRVLRNRAAFIEELDEHLALIPASALRPEPLPLDLKVVLIGSEEFYHLLLTMDDDFAKIFKIKADFDYTMERNKENIKAYSAFIATRCHKEGLQHFDRSGVAAVVEYGSRLAEDQNKLSAGFTDIKNLVIEADFISREQGHRAINRSHVEKALEQQFFRVNLFERHLMDLIRTRDLMISIDGRRIGQVNGLTVYDMGDYSFGRICRITCTTSISDNGIFNIDRASKLSGKIHDKGMFILTGYISALLARHESLGVSASLCFEQSYDMIDGDSASASELTAIISALAKIPVRQNVAITGSLNQLGDIQPVGGINEKIEGFYKTCKLLGKGRSYHVIIPFQNRENLMLHKEARQAISQGFLKVYLVHHFWEVFDIATGIPLGAKTVHEYKFPAGSALDIISKKLEKLHKKKDDSRSKKNKGDLGPQVEEAAMASENYAKPKKHRSSSTRVKISHS
ncbi:MAG: AAA family ATPase [Deltaproteobacteria bacterium]|nr:AAA family ATPase [Deltaproteobacteria bacterium]